MAGERTLPGGGALLGFWTPGSGGFAGAPGIDDNWRKLGAGLASRLVVKSRTTVLPSPGSTGDIYIVRSDDGTNPNKIAVWDGAAGSEAWVYYPPFEGLQAYVQDAAGRAKKVYYDGSAWVHEVPAARVTRSTSFSVPNATDTAIAWELEDYDEGGWFDLGFPTILTAVRAGLVAVKGGVDTASYGGANNLYLWVTKNGEAFPGRGINSIYAESTGSRIISVATEFEVAKNDTISLYVYQNSGSARNLDANGGTFMSARMVT